MNATPSVLASLVMGALAGCSGGGGSTSDAARADIFVPDIVVTRPDASIDSAVPLCSVSQYTFAPTTVPFDGGGPFPCGQAQWIVSGSGEARHSCYQSPWLYVAQGSGVRVQLDAGSRQQFLGWGSAPRGVVACQSFDLLIGTGETLCNALFSAPDLARPAQRIWSRSDPGAASVGASIDELVATDQFIAWVTSGIGYHLFVAGPHGENPRDLDIPISRPPAYLAADGTHLVFWSGGDIWLWTVGTQTPENLTSDPADQWAPWISGNRVVWVDQRDTPSGSLWNPDNPEIYTMDLSTRVPRRITNDPPDHPAVQHLPVIQGDWIVWMDTRNALAPNAGYLTDRMEIWGYYFPTDRQYPIVTGSIRASDPSIVDGRVLLACSPAEDTRGGTFIAPFPDPYATSDAGGGVSVDGGD